MARIVEILIALNALGGIATFLGIRLATRKTREATVRGLEKIGIDVGPEDEPNGTTRVLEDETQPTQVVEGAPEAKGSVWSRFRRHEAA
jgi:hypothetical protein